MFDGKEPTIEIPIEHVLRNQQPTKVYWCLPGNFSKSFSLFESADVLGP
jgi:hypothetical protein